MKQLSELKVGDYIAFKWNHGFYEDGDIIIDAITSITEDQVLVHFLYGLKGEAKWVNKEDILAIGNMDGEHGISGWTGKYDILKPNHPLIIKNLKDNYL